MRFGEDFIEIANSGVRVIFVPANSSKTTGKAGHSIACDPWGEVLWQAGEEECIKTMELDLEEIEKRREELAVASSRR